MIEQIHLATREGIRTAELFTTFDSCIAGETFSFAVHRHLSCSTHVKVSELMTGMGVAEVPFDGLVPFETPIYDAAEMATKGQIAVSGLVEARGARAVADVLVKNRLAAQVLNTRGRTH